MSLNQNKIGLKTAIIVGINAMIGSGVFAIPAALALQAGPAGIITTVLVAFIAWCLALSFAKVAELYPQEGSFYNYTKQWGGHTLGMIANLAYLGGLYIAMGLLTKMAGLYLQHHFDASAYTLGLIVLVILVALNILGVVISEIGQYILIFTTVAPLIVITAMCFGKADLNNLMPFAPFGIASIFLASKVVIFAFFGFESAASLFSIVEDPKKNVPKALSYSLAIVAIIYLLFATSIILAVPGSMLRAPGADKLTSVLIQIFPNYSWLITIINISILSAIIGTIHSMIWGSSQLILSLAKNSKNSLFHNLIEKNILNSKVAVLIGGLIIFLTFTFIDNPRLFFNLTALLIVFAFIMSIIVLLKNTLNPVWKFITFVGLFASGIIALFAIMDLIKMFLI